MGKDNGFWLETNSLPFLNNNWLTVHKTGVTLVAVVVSWIKDSLTSMTSAVLKQKLLIHTLQWMEHVLLTNQRLLELFRLAKIFQRAMKVLLLMLLCKLDPSQLELTLPISVSNFIKAEFIMNHNVHLTFWIMVSLLSDLELIVQVDQTTSLLRTHGALHGAVKGIFKWHETDKIIVVLLHKHLIQLSKSLILFKNISLPCLHNI